MNKIDVEKLRKFIPKNDNSVPKFLLLELIEDYEKAQKRIYELENTKKTCPTCHLEKFFRDHFKNVTRVMGTNSRKHSNALVLYLKDIPERPEGIDL